MSDNIALGKKFGPDIFVMMLATRTDVCRIGCERNFCIDSGKDEAGLLSSHDVAGWVGSFIPLFVQLLKNVSFELRDNRSCFHLLD